MNLGDIALKKQHIKNESMCSEIPVHFNYHGIGNALCGQSAYYTLTDVKGECFAPKRILVIQMQ